jgi:hypothetical protein
METKLCRIDCSGSGRCADQLGYYICILRTLLHSQTVGIGAIESKQFIFSWSSCQVLRRRCPVVSLVSLIVLVQRKVLKDLTPFVADKRTDPREKLSFWKWLVWFNYHGQIYHIVFCIQDHKGPLSKNWNYRASLKKVGLANSSLFV